MPNQSSYINFLNLINAIEDQDRARTLDGIEKELLDTVMVANAQGDDVLVGDLLKLSKIGSQATLHGRIQNLIKLGYLKPISDRDDGRRKKLVPTALAIKHYSKLSKLLAKALTV